MNSELSGYLGIPIFLLVSTWGALKTVVDEIDHLNQTRNFCLGLSADGHQAPCAVRSMVLYDDWLPLCVGLAVAMLIFILVFLMIPPLFRALHREHTAKGSIWGNALTKPVVLGLGHIDIACYGVALLGAFTLLAHLWGGWRDFWFTLAALAVAKC